MTESISPNRVGEFTVDIQHRCPRMGEHIGSDYDAWLRAKDGSGPGQLPVPCADCYSVAVSTVRIPYQPPTERVTVTPEPRERRR